MNSRRQPTLELSEKKHPAGGWRVFPVSLLIGFLAGFLAFQLDLSFGDTLAYRWWHLLCIPPAILVAIWIHELGHFLAGRLLGMQWITLAAGPVRLVRQHGDIRVEWFRNKTNIGGLVIMLPGERGMSRWGWAFYGFGGPLANLLWTAVLFWGLLPLATAGWEPVIGVLGWISLVLGVVNLVPFRTAGFNSDGRNILDVWRGDPAFALGQRIMAIVQQSYSGVRPRDWDSELVQPLLSSEVSNEALMLNKDILLYLYALDSGDADWSRSLIENVEARFDAVPLLLAPPIASILTVHHGLIEPDLQRASRWYEKTQGGLADASMLALAELAMARLRGDTDNIDPLTDNAVAVLARDADRGGVQFFQELLAGLQY